jgi:pantetheine-phosphate adenylyltransferase
VRIAVYPGSFDPVTCAHADIIRRASKLFDKIIVVVMTNSEKKPAFTVNERIEFLKAATEDIGEIEIDFYGGLLADYARIKDASTILKGLRAVSDFEYEFQMALANKKLNPDVDTVFLMASENYMYLSSRIVREIGRHGGNISGLVPDRILQNVKEGSWPRNNTHRIL